MGGIFSSTEAVDGFHYYGHGIKGDAPHQDRVSFAGAVPEVMLDLVDPILSKARKLSNCRIPSMADINLQCKISGRRYVDLESALLELIECKDELFAIQEFYFNQLKHMTKKSNDLERKSAESDKHYSAKSKEKFDKHVDTRMASLCSRKSIQDTAEYARTLMEENVQLRNRFENDTRQILIQETLDVIKPLRDEDKVISNLIDRNSILIDRLASEMNAKISQDESALENISLGNRPMKIAEEYSLLTSNAWLDAKTELDTLHRSDQHEDKKVELLCSVLLEAEMQSVNMYRDFTKAVNQQLQDPVQYKQKHGKGGPRARLEASVMQTVSERSVLPINVETGIGDFLKTTADFVDLSTLYEIVHTVVVSKYPTVARMTERVAMDEYIKQCARLGWKMAIQRPRMRFDYDETFIGQPFPGDNRFDLAWGSEPHVKDAAVRYYKHPPLYHGDKQMIKGSVVVN